MLFRLRQHGVSFLVSHLQLVEPQMRHYYTFIMPMKLAIRHSLHVIGLLWYRRGTGWHTGWHRSRVVQAVQYGFRVR